MTTKSSRDSIAIIGQRLASIRQELGELYGEHEWTRAIVCGQTNLTQNMMWRFESRKGGSIESLLALLNFYKTHGYNPAWVVTDDNTLVSKHLKQSMNLSATDERREALLKKLDQSKQALNKSLDDSRQLLMQL